MARELIPVPPPIEAVASALELVDRLAREPGFDVQRIAVLPEREAPREPAWRLERLLDIAAEVDEVDIRLQMNLWLPVGTHAAHHAPQSAVPKTH